MKCAGSTIMYVEHHKYIISKFYFSDNNFFYFKLRDYKKKCVVMMFDEMFMQHLVMAWDK